MELSQSYLKLDRTFSSELCMKIQLFSIKTEHFLLSSDWKIREDIVDDKFKDTISYTMKDRYIFRPDLSNGLTGEEIVNFSHLALVGAAMAVKRDREAMLPLVSKALKSVFKNPSTIFVKIKAMDLLFNGLVFECDGKEFASKVLCNALKAEGKEVKIINETFVSVSMLGRVSN